MDTMKLMIAASVTFLPVTGALAADATSNAVAALKANLGSNVSLEVDEVRVTEAGVACIEYRVSGSRGHAVVQGNEVLKSSSDAERFEKAWNQHCLGPRGGTTPIG
jgi:hypothetical protein